MFKSLKKLILLLGGMIIISPWLCFGAASRSFNGTSDYMNTSSTVNFGSNIVTISFWLYWDAYAGDDDLATELSTNANNNSNCFFYDPNAFGGTKVSAKLGGTTTGGPARIESWTQPSAGVWHFYSIIFNNSTANGDIDPYVDGIQQSTIIELDTKDGTSNIATQTLYFMSRGGASLFGAGKMAYYQIHNRALSQSEIQQIMYKPGSITTGLVGYWPLWGSNSPEVDLSGNGNTGTLTGTTASSDGPPISLQGAIN